MASAFAHAISAVALGKAFTSTLVDWRFWVMGITCSILPDADVLGFFYGVPYESFWGHRGFTHSFVFAALLGVVVTLLFYREVKWLSLKWWALSFYFFLCTASHAVLDAMTSGGRGVAFFSPFDNARYFLPFRPIKVSPIGVEEFFSEWGMKVIVSELVWVFIPSIVFIIAVFLIKKALRKPV